MNVSKLKPLALALAACVYSAGSLQVAMADDTEIYVPKEVPPDQQVRPNILLVLDTSGSMTTQVTSNPKRNRIQVLVEVVHNLVDDLKNQNVNLGFMRFHGSDGGAVTKAVTELTPTNALAFKQAINTHIVAGGNTPMSETYYEAYRYLAGLKPVWGIASTTHRTGTDSRALVGFPSPPSYASWQYNSPISHSCQKTHIVYITDGAPVSDVGSNTAIRNLINNAKDPQGNLTNTEYTSASCKTSNGQCLPHLAEYMFNQDMGAENGYPKKFSDPTNRKQNVTSHFVGFALNLPLLQNAARVGGGQYFTTSTASGLSEALNSIIVDITASNTTFVAPSIAVTAYNNFGFRDELYYALFRPAEGTNWLGNLKKYRLKTKDNDNKPITPYVVDSNGNPAIADDTGFFRDNAKSFWSSSIDGEDVGKGGFASTLVANQRKIYTWYGADRTVPQAGSVALKVLSNNGTLNTTTTNTTNMPNSALGAANTTERTDILNWIKGIKDTSVQRKAIGDVLHNEPRLVAYVTDEDIERAEGPSSKEEITIFIGTNEGFIHAVDAKTGKEKFAFLPRELHSIPGKYMKDDKGYNNKAYGMDGHFTVWSEYNNRNEAQKTRTVRKVNLYAGMRRGGSNYYALNVLDLNNPELKWVIKGATNPVAERTPGFDKLGLTFSAARLGEMNVGGTRTKVLVFSGGYDPEHDNVGNNVPRNDNLGNALYVVNAETGALIWRATSSNATSTPTDVSDRTQLITAMTNSMPASPAVVDIDGDGLIDVIYASDLRGQVFRFDVNHGQEKANLLKGQLFAKLGGTTQTDNRRFFTTPDVALIRDKGKAPYFTLSLGTGFRESPLNEETNDRFYMLRDFHVGAKLPDSFTPLTENDLTDVSGGTGVNQADVEAQVAIYQGQIDALTAAVQNREADFYDLKNITGYTAAYQQYLAQLQLAQDLQADIDIQSQLPYEPFDVAYAESTDPYNKDFLEEHGTEYGDQAKVEGILLKLHQALAAADSTVQQQLANAYQAVLSQQQAALSKQDQRVQKENFILKGHAQPTLDQAMKDDIEVRFGDISVWGDGNDWDAYGDFSDLAADLSKVLEDDYATQDNSARDLLTGAPGLDAALAALLADPADVTAFTDWANAAGATGATGDAVVLLDRDAVALHDSMQDKSDRFNGPLAVIQTKGIELADATAAAAMATTQANSIANNPANGFQAAEDAVEAAYAATRDPVTGIYALRVKINEEYAKLDVADSEPMSQAQMDAVQTSQGYYLRLTPGEKVLSDSISYNGTVLFSTFTPRGQAVSECGSDVGVGRTFALSLRTGEGVFTQEINGVTTRVRSQLNKQAGIPPTPVIVITEDGPRIVGDGDDDVLGNTPPLFPTYWREQEAEDSP